MMDKIEFKKVSVRVRKNSTKLMIVSAVLLVGILLANSAVSSTEKKLSSLKGSAGTFTTLSAQAAEMESKFAMKKSEVDSSPVIGKKMLTKEEFIKFFADACLESGTDIETITGGNTKILNTAMKEINFKLDIAGTLNDIDKFIEEIQNLRVVYMINDLSLRKIEEFIWLDRNVGSHIGDSWFDENLKKEELPGDFTQLTLQDLYGSDKLKMFIDISFVTISSEV